MSRRAFSLVELLVTVAILAILAAVAVPSAAGMVSAADARRDQANALLIASGINTYNTLHPSEAIQSLPGSWAEAASVLGELWPGGLNVKQCARAYAMVEIRGGRAGVKE